jgi:hypothetical protein
MTTKHAKSCFVHEKVPVIVAKMTEEVKVSELVNIEAPAYFEYHAG